VQTVFLAAHDRLMQNNRTDAWVTGRRFISGYEEIKMSQLHIDAVKNYPDITEYYFTN
jgi:hypothetical protein